MSSIVLPGSVVVVVGCVVGGVVGGGAVGGVVVGGGAVGGVVVGAVTVGGLVSGGVVLGGAVVVGAAVVGRVVVGRAVVPSTVGGEEGCVEGAASAAALRLWSGSATRIPAPSNAASGIARALKCRDRNGALVPAGARHAVQMPTGTAAIATQTRESLFRRRRSLEATEVPPRRTHSRF